VVIRSIMIKNIKKGMSFLFGISPAGRSLTVFPDDIFIVSYPRSGNTWLRFLIGNIVYQNDYVNFESIETKIPDIYQNSEKKLKDISPPRILKSHEYFDPRYKNIIYLVRDPRDVVISYYHYHIKMRSIIDDYPIEKFVNRFLIGELDSYGSWEDNVGSWIRMRQNSQNFLLIHYENVLKDPKSELMKISKFLRINADDERLDRAIELSSKDNMKKLEKLQTHLWKPIRRSRKDKMFVRNARVGGWKDELPKSSAEEIENAWLNLMELLGYLSPALK